MQTRDDRVITVLHPDGSTIVEHADGTRITTFFKEIQAEVAAPDADETGTQMFCFSTYVYW